jgi:predicted Fe-S protein YdhL (DUF1289 family)
MEQEKNNYGLAEKGNGRTCATACREKGELFAWLLMTDPGKRHAIKNAIMKPHRPPSFLIEPRHPPSTFHLTPFTFSFFFFLLSTCTFSSPDTQSVRNALYEPHDLTFYP